MKIIIPMAGKGKRMRPHTLTIPKPLISIAGKPIVQRIVEEISAVIKEKVTEIAFVIGDFGEDVEKELVSIAESVGAHGKIYYQHQALGTAHAILCAADSLDDKVIVAFADTLFKADFSLDESKDGIIWVHKVEDPSAFGVVKTGDDDYITEFVEKPVEFVSDMAIIGIYYFKDGTNFKNELQYLIDNKIEKNGEYQLTDALQNMIVKGLRFSVDKVDEWLDCGNKNAMVYTNQRILELKNSRNCIAETAKIIDSVIIKPCYIGKDAKVINSVIGPHVSVGDNTEIHRSIVSNSIIQNNAFVAEANVKNSMMGNNVKLEGKSGDINIGDFTILSGI
jgi:glucose-1-phosphate thymidylyltransferase